MSNFDESLLPPGTTVNQPEPPSEPSVRLNLDHDEARALHRIVRAMHDGECPRCHQVHPSEAMVEYELDGDTGRGEMFAIGWRCPSCGFSVSGSEARAVFAIFAPFMERNLKVFLDWRAAQGKETQ